MEVLLPILLLVACFASSLSQECTNKRKDCHLYNKYCNSKTYAKFMMKNCAKHCKFCTKPEATCKDVMDTIKCAVWAKAKVCVNEKYKNFMKVKCQKTCGHCPDSGPIVTTRIKTSGKCAEPATVGLCEQAAEDRGKKWIKTISTTKSPKGCIISKDKTKVGYNTGKSKVKCSAVNPCLCKHIPPQCKIKNGGCSDKCKMVGKEVQCSCNKGRVLGANKKKCQAPCFDKPSFATKCKKWSKRNFCTHRRWKKFMAKNCRESCGICVNVAAGPGGACGKDKKAQRGSRIVGGQDARKWRWEWQGGMYYKNTFTGEMEFICGGSLIAPKIFLTAAHCVDYRQDERDMMIMFGDYDRNKKEKPQQRMEVETIVFHEEWSRRLLQHDIALVKLKKAVKYDKYTGPICLPPKDSVPDPKSLCYITGWGKIGAYEGTANKLQEAKLPIVSNDICGEVNVDRQGNSRITDTMICGGYKDDPTSIISGCMGDSGGPYICQGKDGRWTQQGLVSWGSNRCDAQHRYTVFTRLSKYADWIADQRKKWKL